MRDTNFAYNKMTAKEHYIQFHDLNKKRQHTSIWVLNYTKSESSNIFRNLNAIGVSSETLCILWHALLA